jgi:hypothetical protein
MQQGELTVTGADSIIIPLTGFPGEVKCYFKDHVVVAPCNPHHFDELEYEVHLSNTVQGGFILKIMWVVSGVREVVFRIFY